MASVRTRETIKLDNFTGLRIVICGANFLIKNGLKRQQTMANTQFCSIMTREQTMPTHNFVLLYRTNTLSLFVEFHNLP